MVAELAVVYSRDEMEDGDTEAEIAGCRIKLRHPPSWRKECYGCVLLCLVSVWITAKLAVCTVAAD